MGKDDDKVSIGLNAKNREFMDKVMEAGVFENEMDAAKFAMAYALKCGIRPEDRDIEIGKTKWNIGSFDKDSEIRHLISVMDPGTTQPAGKISHLVNIGMEMIAKKFEKSGSDTTDFFLSFMHD